MSDPVELTDNGGPFGYDPQWLVDRERAALAETEVQTAGEAFDPAEHNVEQVLEHVKQHPDSAGDVLAAETDGKARKGIIDALTEE